MDLEQAEQIVNKNRDKKLTDQQIKVPSVNPAIGDSRVLCNSILQNRDLLIDKS